VTPRQLRDARACVRLVPCDLDGAGVGEECDCPRHEVHVRRYARARHRHLIPPRLAVEMLRHYLDRTSVYTDSMRGRV
jgi:hypothetical protein